MSAEPAARQRWFTAFDDGHSDWYVQRFRSKAAEGVDLDGEARFVDALLPRGARVLDAGCGPGRVGAALSARGHTVVGVDVDEILIDAAREDHAGPRWLVRDLATLDLDEEPFDAVVLAGNVMVYLAPGSEVDVLARLVAHLCPGGVLVAGFNTEHPYSVTDFDRDCAAVGLALEHRFATWELGPWDRRTDWAVTVLRLPRPADGAVGRT